MKTLLFTMLLFAFPALALDGKETHGGDTVQIGRATKVFDQVEYDDPFLPETTGDPWTRISTQMQALRTKLPYTADYLESFFKDGNTIWWFVKAQLRDIADQGATNIWLTVDSEQAAINTKGVIQIRKDIWNRLNDDGKATLLMHEMLWSAVGEGAVGNGAKIRFLSRLFLNPNLGKFSAANLAKFIKQDLVKSPLSDWVDYDLNANSSTHGLVPHKLGDDVIVEASELGLQLTKLRPKQPWQRLFRCDHHSKHCPGSLSYWGYTYTTGWEDWHWQETAVPLELADVCGKLRYAEKSDWRLPTADELKALQQLGLLTQKFGSTALYENPTYAYSFNDTFISYASELLTAEGAFTCVVPGKCLSDDPIIMWDDERRQAFNVPYFCVRGRN